VRRALLLVLAALVITVRMAIEFPADVLRPQVLFAIRVYHRDKLLRPIGKEHLGLLMHMRICERIPPRAISLIFA
jgi:hypothetical protein